MCTSSCLRTAGEESAERRARTTKQIEPDVAGISSWLIGRERGICPSALQIWSQRILPSALFGLSIPASKNTRPRNSASIAGAAERERRTPAISSVLPGISQGGGETTWLFFLSGAARRVRFSLMFRASFIISWIGCHGGAPP